MALFSKFGIFFDFFHFESPSKEQMLALGLIPHVLVLVTGIVAGPLCS